MKTLKLFFVIVSLAIFLLSGCNDDEPGADALPGVLVVNEGNFNAGDGSLSTYNKDNSVATQDAYLTNGTTQSAVLKGDQLFVCSNNADKLEILDSKTLEVVATISEGLIDPISFDKTTSMGFVSCWGDPNESFAYPESYVAIIDLADEKVKDTVILGARIQDVVVTNDKVFAAVAGSDVVVAMSVDGEILAEIETDNGPSGLVDDRDGGLWVLTNTGVLAEINTSSLQLTDRRLEGLTTQGYREKMAYDEISNTIYFLGGNNSSFTGLRTVYSVSLNDSELSAEVFLVGENSFYGIAVDPANGDLYLGDSNGFQSTGTGFRYGSDGELIGQFATGIGPNNFVFR